MSGITEKIIIRWDNRNHNFQLQGIMEIPTDIAGKDRIPLLFGPKSLNNPNIHRQGDYVVVTQRTTLARLPSVGTTYLSSPITKDQIIKKQQIEPVRNTFEIIGDTTDVQSRILLKPIVNRTTITFYDSGTPAQKPIDVIIFRKRKK